MSRRVFVSNCCDIHYMALNTVAVELAQVSNKSIAHSFPILLCLLPSGQLSAFLRLSPN